jgi:DeoR family fructose operon transcriptional repressor
LIKLYVTGGNYHINNQAFFGEDAENFLEGHGLDKVFFSCRSFNMVQGLSDSDEQVAALRRMIIRMGEKKFLLADHSKFGRLSFLSTADFSKIDYLMTDEPVNDEWSSFFESKNVCVVECFESDTVKK